MNDYLILFIGIVLGIVVGYATKCLLLELPFLNDGFDRRANSLTAEHLYGGTGSTPVMSTKYNENKNN